MSILNSPLAKIGLGLATGGLGGAAVGALSATNSPAGKAFSMGSTINSIGNKFSEPDPQPAQAQPMDADWSKNSFGGQDYSDQFGAMKRRLGGF